MRVVAAGRDRPACDRSVEVVDAQIRWPAAARRRARQPMLVRPTDWCRSHGRVRRRAPPCRRPPGPPNGRVKRHRKRSGSNGPRQKLGSTPTVEIRLAAMIDANFAWTGRQRATFGIHRQRGIAFATRGQGFKSPQLHSGQRPYRHRNSLRPAGQTLPDTMRKVHERRAA
jgi:hypothetical protein